MWNPFKKITYQSDINGVITIGKRNNEKALYSGGVTQSGGEIAPMWDEVIRKIYNNRHSGKQSASRILKKNDPGQARMTNTILVLGVGGGSVIQAIRKHDRKALITGIELDPVMKQVAFEQFGIKESKKEKIIIANAIEWIQKNHQVRGLVHGLIIVDLYIGSLNPLHARKRKFLEQLKSILKPKGIILYNAHYQTKNKGEYEAFRKMTDKTFQSVEEVFAYPLNRVLLLRK